MSLCLFCLFVAGCHIQPDTDVKIAPEVEPRPPRVGQVTITVRVTRADKPITGAQMKLEANMSHAGMAPVFADAREVEPGIYRANMELTMAGDWIVSVSIILPEGTKVYRQFDVTGVAPA